MKTEKERAMYEIERKDKARAPGLTFSLLALMFSWCSPIHAQVKANDYVLRGTTTHWGVDVFYFVDDLATLETLEQILDIGESKDILQDLKKANSAIIFVVHPDVIVDRKIDPKIATFVEPDQLAGVEKRLAFLGTCGVQQVTLTSDVGYANAFFAFVFHPDERIRWPAEALLNCMERLKMALQ